MIDASGVLDLMQNGLGARATFSPILHGAAGAFFAISGYHKLFNKERHAGLVATLTKDHVPCVKFMQWWVPGWELVAGSALAFSVLSAASALVLAIICLVATACEGAGRVAEFHPIDKADAVDDWLYLPEVIYLVVLGAIVAGA